MKFTGKYKFKGNLYQISFKLEDIECFYNLLDIENFEIKIKGLDDPIKVDCPEKLIKHLSIE